MQRSLWNRPRAQAQMRLTVLQLRALYGQARHSPATVPQPTMATSHPCRRRQWNARSMILFASCLSLQAPPEGLSSTKACVSLHPEALHQQGMIVHAMVWNRWPQNLCLQRRLSGKNCKSIRHSQAVSARVEAQLSSLRASFLVRT